MKKEPKKMWSRPWRYSESVAMVAGIIIVGCLLQLTVGAVNYGYIGWPVNIFIGTIIILLVAAFSVYRSSGLFRWISGVPLSVTLIAALVILGIIMGLIPQSAAGHHHHEPTHLFDRLGFSSMTSSWPFVLTYVFTLISLGCVIVRRLFPFRISDYAFYLNHIGLWLALFAAGLGAADMKRYTMYVREGEVEWSVHNDNGDVLDLPVAIRLNDFDMEEYPPKLAVIDRRTGEAQPEGKPEFFQIDPRERSAAVGRWEVHIDRYIHQAVRNSDSTYHEVPMPGATPAAMVTVTDTSTGGTSTGWVSAGNAAQLYMALNIDTDYAVVMTAPEPKRYMSDIDIFTRDGESKHAVLEVNKPARIGHWRFYQYGYDTEAGRMSTYSAIELVYDPWVVPVYIGLIMLMAGSVCMLWSGNRKKGGAR